MAKKPKKKLEEMSKYEVPGWVAAQYVRHKASSKLQDKLSAERFAKEIAKVTDERSASISKRQSGQNLDSAKYLNRLHEARVLKEQCEQKERTTGTVDEKIEKRVKNWFVRDWEKVLKTGTKNRWWENFDEKTQTELHKLKSFFYRIWDM